MYQSGSDQASRCAHPHGNRDAAIACARATGAAAVFTIIDGKVVAREGIGYASDIRQVKDLPFEDQERAIRFLQVRAPRRPAPKIPDRLLCGCPKENAEVDDNGVVVCRACVA